MTQYNVGTVNPFHLVYAGAEGQGAIVNLDLTNTIIVAPTEGEAYQGLGNINNFIVGPLNYIVVDGQRDYWVIAQSGSPLVDWMPGVSNWAPSPVQAAAQIIASGLATSANQLSQITQETTTATNTGATTTAVNNVNFTTAVVGQNVQGLANIPNPHALNSNAYFTDANGSADVANWFANAITLATAGINSGNALPAGSGKPNGFKATPSGSSTFAIAASQSNIPCVPGQPIFVGAELYPTAALPGVVIINYNNSAGTFLGQEIFQTAGNLTANVWQKISGSFITPQTIGGGTPAYAYVSTGLNSASNIPAADVFYGTAVILDSNVAGTAAGSHAQAIANTGAPPLVFANLLFSEPANTALTSGVPVNTATVPVNQPGYDGYISLSSTAAGPVYVTVFLNWTQNGNVIATEVWGIICGTAASPHILFLKGPTKGDHLQVEIESFSANATLVNFQMYQNSRVYERDDWRSVQCNAFQGGAAPFSNAPGLELAYRIINPQGIGATDNTQLPTYAGKVRLFANTASGTNDLTITITDVGSVGVTTGEVVFQTKSDANGNINSDVILPRSTCQVAMHNGNAAAQETRYAVIIEEY